MPLAPPSLAAGETSLPASPQAHVSTTLSLAPSSVTVRPGDDITVTVNLNMVSRSHAITFLLLQLSFDPQVLQATSFEPNTADLPQLNVIERTPLDPGVGTIGLALGTGPNAVNAIQDSGTVATITFHVVETSSSSTLVTWQRFAAHSIMPSDPANLNAVDSANLAIVCLDGSNCIEPRLYLPLIMALN
jgi:hypothetical protein